VSLICLTGPSALSQSAVLGRARDERRAMVFVHFMVVAAHNIP